MKKLVQIVTATDTEESAEKIANTLVKNRLAACVQIIGPIKSVYWWKGTIEKTSEWLCIAKTRQDLYTYVESLIKANHSYDVPEILAHQVLDGNQNYLSWLNEELRK